MADGRVRCSLRSLTGALPVNAGRGVSVVLASGCQAASGKTGGIKKKKWSHSPGKVAEMRSTGGMPKLNLTPGKRHDGKRQSIFDVENPRGYEHSTQLVEVLNPLAREQKSVETLRDQLATVQEELARAHQQVHLSEARVKHTLQKLADMEAALNDKLLQLDMPKDRNQSFTGLTVSAQGASIPEREPQAAQDSQAAIKRKKGLDVSGPLAPYPTWLKNFWYPVTFSAALDDSTMISIGCFEEPWVLSRGKDGKPGCVRDECAHIACPLSLGTLKDRRIQSPYHGWEYSTGDMCEKMPSTKFVSTSKRSLPCIEQDGMIWIWPGNETPEVTLPSLIPPEGYTIHAEIVLELPVEHGLLVENLLDLAHAPFTHITTFAKGWAVPSSVSFKTPVDALQGYWDPYPIDMAFQPPCMVLSTIGLAKPGQLDGSSTALCSKHLHQLHVCMPSSRGKTRLLYRMALDFASWAKHVPFIHLLWEHLANQVLAEDLRLVVGQQDRMCRGANVWNQPVAYDKLGVGYRRWRNAVESGDRRLPFGGR